ncbi:MAG: hypothetical protein K2X66_12355, partial [Cyanobacteria bacterium]|nr:hypothetical protein [Cyanobacteriota bacterium]
MPIFSGAKTYLSALFKGVASGGTSGAAMGGVGQMAKDQINHGEVDMGKALESSATGFAGGAAFGGAFGSLGHHLKVRSFKMRQSNHSVEPPLVNPPPTLPRPPRGGGSEVITTALSSKPAEPHSVVFPSLSSTIPTPKAVIPPPIPKASPSPSTVKSSRKAIAFQRFEQKLQSQPGGNVPSSQELLMNALKGKPLGEGATNSVYLIPEMPGYVLRIRKSLIPKVTEGQLSLKSPEMVPDCLPGRNIGQAIGKISYEGQKGFGGPEIQICKRQRGMPVGDMVRRYVVRKQSAGVPVTQTYDQIFYKKMNRMPQESFDHLARRINQIDRAGREIDSSHQYNLYISPKGKKFGWVDIERRMSPKKPGYNNT